MAAQSNPNPEPRAPLSRERVLQAAVRLADESGIESLTMRRLAQELGVEAMSLYYYVDKKDDILNGIVDIVVGEIELPSGDAHWKAALRRCAISAHEVLLRHPWSCSLMLYNTTILGRRLRFMDSLLATLRRAGFSPEMTHHAYHALDSHLMGFTLWEASFTFASEDLAALGASFLETLPTDEFPHLAEHVEQHLVPSTQGDEGEFEFGLDLILDGLERTLDTP